jgi:hypothetical protein
MVGQPCGRIVIHEAKIKQVRALQDCEDAMADHSPRMRTYTQPTRWPYRRMKGDGMRVEGGSGAEVQLTNGLDAGSYHVETRGINT